MALESWKKVFVFLLVLCGTLLVTMRIGYQVDITSLHGYLWKSQASDPESPMRDLGRKSMKQEAKSFFVFPGRSSMAFESSPVLRYFYRLPQSHHPSDKHRLHQWLNDSLPDLSANKSESKLILFYNPPSWFSRKVRSFCRLGLNMCPIKSCRCSIDPTDLEKADAVIVDAVYLNKPKPMIKKTSQVWIFFALESPVHVLSSRYKSEHWRQMFNWTYTYRLDSDIAKPNDMLFHQSVSKNYTSMAQKKTKSAVWLVSHCRTNSKRELYVKELQKYYNVDIFGRCGKRTKLNDASLLNPYRFYLSFENSFCFDYITEKLFKTYAADINIIPVVRGGADYDTMIPNGTFINAAHFNTPKELGKYLSYLEKNVTAYAEYLRENDQFVNEGRDPGYQISFCEICVKMHNVKLYANWYTDIGKWYSEGTCKNATDF